MECGEGQTDAVSGNAAFGLFYVDSEDPRRGGAKMLYEELQQVKAAMRPGPRLDLDTAHVFCQWQSCLQMGLYLNQLLSTPLPEPNLIQEKTMVLKQRSSESFPCSFQPSL